MASKRRIRRKQCDGKRRHATPEAAAGHRRFIHATAGYSGLLNVYRCSFCGGYHVGHGKQKYA